MSWRAQLQISMKHEDANNNYPGDVFRIAAGRKPVHRCLSDTEFGAIISHVR